MKGGKILFALIFAVFLFVSAHGCCCCCPCCCCRRRHYLRHQYRQLQHHGGHHHGALPPVNSPTGEVNVATVLRGKLATEAPRTEAVETARREEQKNQVVNRTKKTIDTKNTDRREQ